jgi:hypothetical protein
MGDSQTFWGKDGGECWAEVDAALDTRTVHERSRGGHRRRSRTVENSGERTSAVLEGVLVAAPQEFESLILRHS